VREVSTISVTRVKQPVTVRRRWLNQKDAGQGCNRTNRADHRSLGKQLRCAECGMYAESDADGWRAFPGSRPRGRWRVYRRMHVLPGVR
jgi:hypothetical protein